MDRSSSNKRWFTALLLFVLVAGFYWKLTLTRQFEWMRGPDVAEQVLPWFDVQAAEFHHGRVPLWDPYLWSGQPLLGQAQPGAAYPLNWLLFAMPLEGGHISPIALAWYFVIIHLMAAAFCYLLCRDLDRSRAASIAAGLIFTFSGYLGDNSWPQMINGAVWAPLVFLFQLRTRRDGRVAANAALSGLFLGIAWLSGHHQIPILISVAWLGVWIWMGYKDRRVIPGAAFALVIAGLVGALQTLPAYEYGHLARRWVGAPQPVEWNQPVPYSVHAHYDLEPFSLFGIVFPDVPSHFSPFVGIVALALALLGIACAWSDWRVRLLSAIGLGGLFYALGDNSVFQGFLYAVVPSLDKARNPSSAMLLFQFAAAALAAFGIDHLAGSWTRVAQRSLTAFGVFMLAASMVVMLASKLTIPGGDSVILTAVIALLLAALLFARQREALSTPTVHVFLVLLLLVELGNFAKRGMTFRDRPSEMTWLNRIYSNADVAEFLRKQPGFPRVEVVHDEFAPNWGAWHRVEMYGGKGASVTTNVLDSELFSQLGHRLWAVGYTIVPEPKADAPPAVFTGASGMRVYRRDNAFPRAWAVHELLRVESRPSGNAQLFGEPEAYHRKAYMMEQLPTIEPCAATENVEMVEHTAGHLAVTADLSCVGMVVVSDTFFPGWRAEVDRKPAKIYEVNGAMRGVVVPAGKHKVTMRYRPFSVYLGAGLTLLGVVAAMAAVFIPAPTS
jgi:hypothetical protein